MRGTLVGLLALALLLPAPSPAQQTGVRRQIRESQQRLEEIRSERDRLQQEMTNLQGHVQDASGELQNIERQLSTSRSVVAEIDFQMDAVTGSVEATTTDLVMTRERIREGHAVLNRRLRDIYKRGALNTVRVLLGADSFADLITRYRYLRLIASYDRALVNRVESLETELVAKDRDLRRNQSELGRLRQDKLGEVAELRQVEDDRSRVLDEYRNLVARAETRLEQLERDEGRLSGMLVDLERRRVAEERRVASRGGRDGPAGAGEGTLSREDAGGLDWPVSGELLYRFGRDRRPNGTVLRWNGIGIRAQTGSPVRAVRSGTVVMAGPFEGYGPTVVLSHGDGFYTLYLYLEQIGVIEGRDVAAGQVVGTVGGSDTPEGPHIEFQVRAPATGSIAPQAMDPLLWLKPGGTGR